MFICKWRSAGSNPMDKSAYRKANSCSASQEIATPCGTKFTTARHISSTHSHTSSLRSISVLSFQIRLHIPDSIFLPGLSYKNSVYMCLPTHASSMPRPSRPPWFHHSNNIWMKIEIMKPRFQQLSAASCYFLPLGPRSWLTTLLSNTFDLFTLLY